MPDFMTFPCFINIPEVKAPGALFQHGNGRRDSRNNRGERRNSRNNRGERRDSRSRKDTSLRLEVSLSHQNC